MGRETNGGMGDEGAFVHPLKEISDGMNVK
jgi:hypothetical protein